MIREIGLGVGIVMLVLGLPLACGGAGNSPLARCKLDIVQRVRACHQAESDGGR